MRKIVLGLGALLVAAAPVAADSAKLVKSDKAQQLALFQERSIFTSGLRGTHTIALTFDDGPNPHTGEVLDALRETNVRATFVVAQECAALMRAGGRGGRIVNISSILGTIGRAKLHAYCASKSAIVGLTRSLAAELGKDGITANVIAPGYFVTDINASLTSRPGYVEAVNGVNPMQRWGQPEELVGTLVYLASAASSYVNGQVIHVDGGTSASFTFELAA